MAKPVGPACNLDCTYCFYTEKQALFPAEGGARMSDDVLEAYVRKYIEDEPTGQVHFAWQGGEPTLAGRDFFERAVELERIHARGRHISNSFQTNGILLDDEWCEFLAANGFLVGLSLDGPEDVHDRYRVESGGGPTWSRVMGALALLQKHGVEFNILATVTSHSAQHPRDVYGFFKEAGATFIQFIPVVERLPDAEADRMGLKLAVPGDGGGGGGRPASSHEVTPWTVEPHDFGEFLNGVFDQWVAGDVGSIFVMTFEAAVAAFAGLPAPFCTFQARCGRAVIVERNGDVYSCDHFVYPRYKLGNILEDSPAAMIDSPAQRAFGDAKESTLPEYCRQCDVLFACRGQCPKHRFRETPTGQLGLNYLCEGYKMFFAHVAPHMRRIASLISQKRPAADYVR